MISDSPPSFRAPKTLGPPTEQVVAIRGADNRVGWSGLTREQNTTTSRAVHVSHSGTEAVWIACSQCSGMRFRNTTATLRAATLVSVRESTTHNLIAGDHGREA